MTKSKNISKTAYCRGVQCPIMMWLKEYNPEAFDNSVVNQSALNTGNEVGDLAMGLFGPFTEVKRDAESKMSLETEKLIASGEKVITERTLGAIVSRLARLTGKERDEIRKTFFERSGLMG